MLRQWSHILAHLQPSPYHIAKATYQQHIRRFPALVPRLPPLFVSKREVRFHTIEGLEKKMSGLCRRRLSNYGVAKRRRYRLVLFCFTRGASRWALYRRLGQEKLPCESHLRMQKN